VGEFAPGYPALLFLAPELRRGRAGLEAAEHARRFGLAALRLADGQIGAITTIAATALRCYRIQRVCRRRAYCGMMGTLRPAALVVTAGESPLIATATIEETSAPGQPRGQAAQSRALPAVEPLDTGRPRRGTGLPVMAGNGRQIALADRQAVRLAARSCPEALPFWPTDRLHGPLPAGQRLAPNGLPVVGADY